MDNPSPTSIIKWGNIAQWAAACATLLAVLIALFKDEIIRLWRRPKLTASIKPASPDCVKILQTFLINHITVRKSECYYLRLWIWNKGRDRAEKVQVFVNELSKRTADGTFFPIREFLPMNLRWSHSHEIFADGISPRMGKHCDLGHITHPSVLFELNENLPEVSQGKTVLALDLEEKPNTKSNLIPPGTYRLGLRIGGANCSPISKTLEITLIGDWFDDHEKMFRDGIGIKMIE